MRRLIFFLICSLSLSPFAHSAAIDSLVRQIETRQGKWVFMHAALQMDFQTAGTSRASCQGELYYQRLDEKIILNCFNEKNVLLFSFKTIDRNFQLYLPGQKALYHGNIFELEDSPAIQSHIRALDLYRTIKSLVIPADRARIEKWSQRMVTLSIRSEARFGSSYLARQMTATQEGDILSENYFNQDGQLTLAIQKSNFKKLRCPVYFDQKATAVFPHRISMNSFRYEDLNHNTASTILTFKNIDFEPIVNQQLWQIRLAPQTEIIPLNGLLLGNAVDRSQPINQ